MGMRLRINNKAIVEESLTSDEVEQQDVPVSPTSAYFASDVLSACILGIFESEINIDISSLYSLKDIFLSANPRFSSILVEDERGRKTWRRKDVNLKDHFKVPIFPEGLSPERYSQYFDDYITKIAKEQLPKDKPLWEIHIVNYPTSKAAATFVVKIHHAIGDGTSLMAILFSCFQRADDPTVPLAFPSARARSRTEKQRGSQTMKSLSTVLNLISSIFYSLYDFGQSVRRIIFEDDQTPIRSGCAELHPPSIRISTVTFSLDDFKTIKAYLGVTINDVIVGIIFLGIRLYMRDVNQGIIRNTRSTALVIANSRSINAYARPEEMSKENAEVSWGNKMAFLHIPVPNLNKHNLANPLYFVKEAHKTIKCKRNSFSPSLMAGFLEATRIFGGSKAACRVFDGVLKKPSLAISNLIGPTEKMSAAGHPIKGFYFMPVGVKLSLTVSVMSYIQQLRIGISVEEGFIDHQKLITCVETAFQLILQAANATQN